MLLLVAPLESPAEVGLTLAGSDGICPRNRLLATSGVEWNASPPQPGLVLLTQKSGLMTGGH